MEQALQPDRPPRIEHGPTTPVPRKSWAVPTYFAVLFSTLGAPFVLLAPLSDTRP